MTRRIGGTKAAGRTGSVRELAEDVREDRFSTLPEHVAFKDLIAEKPAAPPNPERDSYDSDGLAARYSCLAADLGL